MWAAGLDAAGRLFRVTRLLDPDPFRNQIRDAVLIRRTPRELKRLAGGATQQPNRSGR